MTKGEPFIVEVEDLPVWRGRLLRGIAMTLFLKKVHVILTRGFKYELKSSPCIPCNGLGRMMQVETYDVVDCPRCNGRGTTFYSL